MSKNKYANSTTMSYHSSHSTVEVKSKFDAEFRRFGLQRNEESASFEKFQSLIRQLHGLQNIQFVVRYIDPRDQELLPINNDDNFGRALKTAQPLLRIIVQREEDLEYGGYGGSMAGVGGGLAGLKSRNNHFNIISMLGQTPSKSRAPPISMPHDFRQVSAIIDVDIVPETHRRVRLLKHGSDKPLGFYIRDGTSVRVTPNGLEKQPGIFISRLVPGGLAESTGLLAVNDEVIEVNGIEVAGKTLDQVTDMMVANSSNLIITFKPANQRTLTSPRRGSLSRTSQLSGGSHHTNQTNTSDELEPDEQDEIVDLTGVTLDDNNTPVANGGGGATSSSSQVTINSAATTTTGNGNATSGGSGGSGSGSGSGNGNGGSGIIESHDGVLHL